MVFANLTRTVVLVSVSCSQAASKNNTQQLNPTNGCSNGDEQWDSNLSQGFIIASLFQIKKMN